MEWQTVNYSALACFVEAQTHASARSIGSTTLLRRGLLW